VTTEGELQIVGFRVDRMEATVPGFDFPLQTILFSQPLPLSNGDTVFPGVEMMGGGTESAEMSTGGAVSFDTEFSNRIDTNRSINKADKLPFPSSYDLCFRCRIGCLSEKSPLDIRDERMIYFDPVGIFFIQTLFSVAGFERLRTYELVR